MLSFVFIATAFAATMTPLASQSHTSSKIQMVVSSTAEVVSDSNSPHEVATVEGSEIGAQEGTPPNGGRPSSLNHHGDPPPLEESSLSEQAVGLCLYCPITQVGGARGGWIHCYADDYRLGCGTPTQNIPECNHSPLTEDGRLPDCDVYRART